MRSHAVAGLPLIGNGCCCYCCFGGLPLPTTLPPRVHCLRGELVHHPTLLQDESQYLGIGKVGGVQAKVAHSPRDLCGQEHHCTGLKVGVVSRQGHDFPLFPHGKHHLTHTKVPRNNSINGALSVKHVHAGAVTIFSSEVAES